MRSYLIHRTVPGAGQMDASALAGITTASNDVLTSMAPRIQWVHSYVVDDGIVCLYRADGEAVIREHARCGGFPVDTVQEVRAVIDPTTTDVPS